jgi:hypothetical protein
MKWYKLASLAKDKMFDLGLYPVFRVDEFSIRNLSPGLEEFTNFAIHDDFPELIPEREIWISEEVPEDEARLFAYNAAKRYDLLADGYDQDYAYDEGLKYEKALREKKDLAATDRDFSDISSQDIYLREYGKIYNDGLTVWIVDGNLVRDLFDTQFVEGGNGYALPWVPKDEIWIDNELKEEEIPYIIKHEYVELKLMKDDGMPYEEAHHEAALAEYRMRIGNS